MVGRNILEHPAAKEYEFFAPDISELDLFNFEAVKAYVGKVSPDIVIHAAGRVGGIQANMAHPVAFLLENLDMGRNLVWAARQCGVKKLINLGSSCMYPRNAENPLKEEMVLKGELEPTNEGYAIAKVTVSRLCSYISKETPEFSYKTLIPCNLYGRWDKFSPEHSHMIPAVIRKLHEAKVKGLKTIDIWGDGTARREFMYAGDVADCIHRAVTHFDTMPELMNVGLGGDHSVNDYYQAVAEVVGYKGSFIHDLTKPAGMARKLVDTSRLQAWGWKASTSLKDGIAAAYDFFKTNYGDNK
ncbi:MAG: GDP-fucose synthetase [Elusimicrobia bacterium GWC2_63_65]|nr:MAG: GDP-fucose synthetase [Elusimicrobia bacterium GWC2_63_65]